MTGSALAFRDAVCRIQFADAHGPGPRGTGFLVSPRLVLTALHVVADRRESLALAEGGAAQPAVLGDPIPIQFRSGRGHARVIDGRWDPRQDWALLEIVDEPDAANALDIRPIPLGELRGETPAWRTFGFPDAKPDGMVVEGTVSDPDARYAGVPAIQLYGAHAAASDGMPVPGLSGSPCVVGGAVVGLLRSALLDPRSGKAIAGTLFACPVQLVLDRCADLLPVPDPVRGLPGLPAAPLPASPFRYLHWFEEDHAEVLFGRSREIRALHGALTEPDAPPVVLVYGQSGVGKSSLLAGGVVPRLRGSREVHYLRHDPAAPLHEALQALRAAREHDRPLVAILDQVEEVFHDDPARRGALVAILRELAIDRRPDHARDRVVLSFRKEWLPEIRERLTEAEIPSRKLFIEPLGARGVAEVVRGVASSPRLRAHYGVAVEPMLGEVIAADLTGDPDSPVAPVLSIVMTQLWEALWDEDRDRDGAPPTLTIELYQRIRARGLHMSDFLRCQLAEVRAREPELIRSGLALDLLYEHTDPHGGTAELSRDALRAKYGHCDQDELARLVAALEDAYLIARPPGRSGATRLAHDTLAPVVRRRFQLSQRPGQLARRVLENRRAELLVGMVPPGAKDALTGDTLMVSSGDSLRLEADAYELIRRGMRGMRGLTEDEATLVRDTGVRLLSELASDTFAQVVRSELMAQRARVMRRMRIAGLIAVAVAVAGVVIGWLVWDRATAINALEREKAERAMEQAAVDREGAQRAAEAARITAAARATDLDPGGDPTLAAALLAETARRFAGRFPAWLSRWQLERFFDPSSGGNDRQLFLDWRRYVTRALRQPIARWIYDGHHDAVTGVAVSPDGARIVTISRDFTARIWSAEGAAPVAVFARHTSPLTAVAFHPDGDRVITADDDGVTLVWSTRGLIAAGGDATGAGRGTNASERPTYVQAEYRHATPVRRVMFSGEGARALTLAEDGVARVWAAPAAGSRAGGATGDGAPVAPIAELRRERARAGDATGDATGAAIGPRGERVVTGHRDGSLALWRVGQPRPIATLAPGRRRVVQLAISADGAVVVAGAHDGAAIAWWLDAPGRPHVTAREHVRAVTAVAVSAVSAEVAAASPGSARYRVVTGGADGASRVWHLGAGEPPDGSGRGGRANRGGRADTGRSFTAVDAIDHGAPITTVAISPDGAAAAIGWSDALVCVSQLDGSGRHRWLHGHENAVTDAAFALGGSALVTASADTTARLWPALFDPALLVRGNIEDATTAAISPTGAHLAAADGGGTVWVWQLSPPYARRALRGHADAVTALSFSPDGARLLSASEDRTARIWWTRRQDCPPGAGGCAVVLTGHTGELTHAGFSPDGASVVTASEDRTVRVWGVTGESIAVLEDHGDEVTWAAFIPGAPGGSARLLTIAKDGVAHIWHVSARAVVARLPLGCHVQLAALSPDNRRLATVCHGTGDVKVWSVSDPGAPPEVLAEQHEEAITALAFSPSATHLITASADETGHVWELASRGHVELLGHRGAVVAAALGPGGARAITGSLDGTARLWNAASGALLAEFTGHRAGLCAAGFGPEGRRAFTAGADGDVRVWDVEAAIRAQGELYAASDVWTETEKLRAGLREATSHCLSVADRRRVLHEDRETAHENYDLCIGGHGGHGARGAGANEQPAARSRE